MLTAFRMDLDVRRYATFQALRGYTARSADPVGRLLLALFGYREPELVRYADELSTALQLTNFWQDVAADAARDHIYIPAEDLHFFGVTEADVKALEARRTALRDLMRFEVARTRALYERGRPLLDKLGSDLRMELTLIWLVGTTILDKIEAADYDVFTQRPAIRRRDKAVIMARAAKDWATPPGSEGAQGALAVAVSDRSRCGSRRARSRRARPRSRGCRSRWPPGSCSTRRPGW